MRPLASTTALLAGDSSLGSQSAKIAKTSRKRRRGAAAAERGACARARIARTIGALAALGASLSACARPCPQASVAANTTAPTTPTASPSAAQTAAHTNAPPSPCAAPTGDEEPISFDGKRLVLVCRDVYVDPEATEKQRTAIRRDYAASQADLTGFFGAPLAARTAIVVCTSEACTRHFAGPTQRSRVIAVAPRPVVLVVGVDRLTRGTMTHESVHIEAMARLGKHVSDVPTWFHEGLATYLGDNVDCPANTPRAIDDVRKLRDGRAWEGFTNIAGKGRAAYCQVRDEVAAWVRGHDRRALAALLSDVVGGKSFDDAYGTPLTTEPPEKRSRARVGFFPLDENAGTDTADTSRHSLLATLMRGAIWTAGRRGAAVKVKDGSFVRADGLIDIGIPDSPFTITLWAKPLANRHVLVHMAETPSGSRGWCIPILGHDAAGHLVGQVTYDADPQAFLAATGPVLPLGRWTHVAMTWSESDGVRLFVDGALTASAPPKSAAQRHRDGPAAPTYLFFGGDGEAQCWTKSIEPGNWDGAIDEIRIYDYALSPADVKAEQLNPG